MRISDWSSDVCSSDLEHKCLCSLQLPLQFRCIFIRLCRRLRIRALASGAFACAGGLFWLIKFDVLAIEREIHTVAYLGEPLGLRRPEDSRASRDRQSVVSGKRVSVRVAVGGCRLSKKQ